MEITPKILLQNAELYGAEPALSERGQEGKPVGLTYKLKSWTFRNRWLLAVWT
mgnify:CR=1 FL=1